MKKKALFIVFIAIILLLFICSNYAYATTTDVVIDNSTESK